MSGKVINQVLDANFTRAETLVLIAIANHTNDQGKGCYANEAKLAYHTKYVHLSTLREILSSLVERGVVVERHDPRLGDVWDIDLEKLRSRSFMLWKRQEWPKLVGRRPQDSTPDSLKSEHSRQEACAEKRRSTGENAPENGAEDTPNSLVAACAEKRRTIHILRPLQENLRTYYNARGAERAAPQKGEPDMAQRYPDSELEYVSDEEEYNAKRRNSPQTDLQQKVAVLCEAKYLSPEMKGKLRSTVTVTPRRGLPVTHASPEEEWKAHPEWFAEYVEHCAKRIREESQRPPSRGVLISSIRAYGRPNTGWLAFKDAKQREQRTREARRPPAVRRHFSADPEAPAWRQ